MARDLELALRIRADLESAVGKLKRLERSIEGTGRASDKAKGKARGLAGAWERLSGRSQALTRRIGGVRAALISLGAVAVTARIARSGIEIERLESRFRAATGSVQAARRELEFTRQEAERLGIDFRSAAHAYSGFAAAARGTALEGEQTRQIFIAVSEASRVMGLSAGDTAGVLTALQQIISKGTVQAEELRGQLGERLPGAFQIAARAMGVTTAELGKMLERGEVMAEDLLPKLAAELRKTFGPEVESAAETADAAFKRLGNAIDELEASIARSGLLDFLADAAKLAAEVIDAASGTGRQDGAPQTALETRAAQLRQDIAAAGKAAARAPATAGHVGRLQRTRAIADDGGALEIKISGDSLEALRRALAETESGLEEQLEKLRAARAALIAQGRGAGPSGLIAYQSALSALNDDIDTLLKRRARASAEVADLFGSRGQTLGSGDPEDAEKTTKKASAAERYAQALERSIIAARDLTHEERALAEIRSGRLGEVTEAERQRIVAHAQALDRIEKEKEKEAELAEQREKAARDHRDAIEAIESASLDLATPYQRAIAEINRWREEVLENLDRVAEGHEAYAERVAQVNKIVKERLARAEAEHEKAVLDSSRRWQDGVTRALRTIADEAGDSASFMEDATLRAFSSMEDALVEFVTTGKLEFADLANSIIAELARIAIRKSITEPLAEGLEGVLGDFFHQAVRWHDARQPQSDCRRIRASRRAARSTCCMRAAGRRRSRAAAAGRWAPGELFAHAPRYHRGGIAGQLRPNEVPVIVEKGEGVFTAEQMAALGGRAEPRIEFNLINQGTGKRETGGEVRFDAGRWVVSVMTDDIDNNGPFTQALFTAGGLRRQGV